MRLKTTWVWAASLALPLGLGAASTGCAYFIGEHEAKVAQGQQVQTGQAAYDDFFAEVLKVREEATKVPDKHAGVNKPLADAMGLADSASPDDTVAEAGKRASELQKLGLLLHLELTPDARVVHVQKKKGALDEQSKNLLKAVEASAKMALAAVDELGTVRERAAKLEKTRIELISQSASDFDEEAPIARSAVQQELDASKDVIADAEAESGRHAGLAAKFIVDLARAIETGAGASKPYVPPPPPPAAPPPAPKPAWRPQPVKPKPPPADFDP